MVRSFRHVLQTPPAPRPAVARDFTIVSEPRGTLSAMQDFYSIYDQGLVRVAACTLPVALGKPLENARRIVDVARDAAAQGVALTAFPELSLTGYSLDDLFLQDALLEETLAAIEYVRHASEALFPVIVVGAPIRRVNRLYNCAVVIHRGNILGVVPKSYLPNYREFYEKRYFASGIGIRGSVELPGVNVDRVGTFFSDAAAAPCGDNGLPGSDTPIHAAADCSEDYSAWPARTALAGSGEDLEYGLPPAVAPFGPHLIFRATDMDNFIFHVEICEDMWVPVTPASRAALAGATVLVNISGSPVTVGREDDRALLIAATSARCKAAYIYAANGQGESTTDLTWDGQGVVYESGTRLASAERFQEGTRITAADVDLEVLRQERMRQGSFDDNRIHEQVGTKEETPQVRDQFREVFFRLDPPTAATVPAVRELKRPLSRFPFMAVSASGLDEDCYETFHIQVNALTRRLRSIGSPRLIIGVSGGLDSTQALLVAAGAMDRLGRDRSDILAYTLPGFATSAATKNNAGRLCRALGIPLKEIDIRPVAQQMLADMGHPFAHGEPVYDTTFENVQAGLRTDYLFRLAGYHGGIVLGTGDLSELALGWATFGVGDHMSHYNVNTGIPKTLMQHLLRWTAAGDIFGTDASAVIEDILSQEISPELVPADASGHLQSTQALIGPYELQDFTLFYLLRHGLRPSKIAFYEWHAWQDAAANTWPPHFPANERHEYTLGEIKGWMELFFRRFFANQFKRSTLPNGPKVVSGGTLSPRGDWRMPSDATPEAWLANIATIPAEAVRPGASE